GKLLPHGGRLRVRHTVVANGLLGFRRVVTRQNFSRMAGGTIQCLVLIDQALQSGIGNILHRRIAQLFAKLFHGWETISHRNTLLGYLPRDCRRASTAASFPFTMPTPGMS